MIFFISAPIPKRWTRSKRIKATECVLSHCDDQQTPIFKTCQTKQHKPRIHCFVKLKMISNKFWLIWWLAKHQRKFHAFSIHTFYCFGSLTRMSEMEMVYRFRIILWIAIFAAVLLVCLFACLLPFRSRAVRLEVSKNLKLLKSFARIDKSYIQNNRFSFLIEGKVEVE